MDALAVLKREIHRNGRAIAAGHEVCALYARSIERVTDANRRVNLANISGLRAEAGKIDRNDAMITREIFDLLAPHSRIKREAVEENERNLAIAGSARLALPTHRSLLYRDLASRLIVIARDASFCEIAGLWLRLAERVGHAETEHHARISHFRAVR